MADTIDICDLRAVATEAGISGFAYLERAMVDDEAPRRSCAPMISKGGSPPPPGPIR